MAASYPAPNDKPNDLWKRIAWNWYNLAVNDGVAGLNPPNWDDSIPSLMKKTAYYIASLSE